MDNLKQKLLSLDFFVDNEYLDFYCSLMEQNINTLEVKNLTERHHIIQRQIFKLLKTDIDNSDNNLINLSHFDHCKAHYYLCLCTKGNLKYSNQHAFMRMVKIKDRFENFNFELFLTQADKYNSIYQEFIQHQSKLNSDSYKKRGGGATHGMHSYTNGVENTFAFECPEGWWPGRIVKKATEEVKKHYKESAIKRCKQPGYREKMIESCKKYYETHAGSATGKVWITNDVQDKYIDKDTPLPDGWRFGRKKFKNK